MKPAGHFLSLRDNGQGRIDNGQLSRTTKHSAVKDVNLPEIFVVFKSGIVISFILLAAKIRLYPRRSKDGREKDIKKEDSIESSSLVAEA